MKELNIEVVINNHKPEWEQIIKEVREKYKISSEITLEFCSKFEFNASVKITQTNNYLITIDRQVFEVIYNFYHSTLNEQNPSLVNMLSYLGYEKAYDEEYAKTLANLYIYLTLKFIFLHELGHVMNGHIGYYDSINGNKNLILQLNENTLKDFNGLTAHEYQMLEINADAFATTNLMIGLMKDLQTIPSYLDQYKKVIPGRNQLILISITSNIISMLIQGMGVSKDESKINESKYIPQKSRLLEILKVYIYFSNDINNGIDNEISIDLINPLIIAYEELVNGYLIAAGYRSESEFLKHDLNDPDLEDYLTKHITCLYTRVWPLLKPKLTPFAILPSENLGG